MENQGIALSREKILNHVWNYDYFGDARTIDTHVKKLRSKMGDKGDYIKTIWGMGYTLADNRSISWLSGTRSGIDHFFEYDIHGAVLSGE